jgi:hypothetical protein
VADVGACVIFGFFGQMLPLVDLQTKGILKKASAAELKVVPPRERNGLGSSKGATAVQLADAAQGGQEGGMRGLCRGVQAVARGGGG